MELTLTTPALLFPAISLLFLSYTNKFLALASLIRSLSSGHVRNPDDPDDPDNVVINKQLTNLRRRIRLIKHMQGAGILSFILCVIDMFLLHLHFQQWGALVFGLCLVVLLVSLVICFLEIKISVDALEVQVDGMEHCNKTT